MAVSEIFKAIGEALGLIKQERDPENIRKRRMREIEKELKDLEVRRDFLLQEKIDAGNKEKNAVNLGLIVRRIHELRAERETLKR